MLNQNGVSATGLSKAKIITLALVFAAAWLLEYSAFAMSGESAALLDQAAIDASQELASMNKEYNATIRTRIQNDVASLQADELILPEKEENQVASAK